MPARASTGQSVWTIVDDLHLSVAGHDEIIAAVAAGDPDGIERAPRTNWKNGCAWRARVLEIFGERGSWQTARQRRD